MIKSQYAAHRFVCECGNVVPRKFKWSDDNTPEKCEQCGTDMIMDDHNNIVDAPTLLTFKSMNTEQRRQVLLKRSHEHFNKNIKDQKFETGREFARQGREMFGMKPRKRD